MNSRVPTVIVLSLSSVALATANDQLAAWLRSLPGGADLVVDKIEYRRDVCTLFLRSTNAQDTPQSVLQRISANDDAALQILAKFAHAVGKPVSKVQLTLTSAHGAITCGATAKMYPSVTHRYETSRPSPTGVPCMAGAMSPTIATQTDLRRLVHERLGGRFNKRGRLTILYDDHDLVEAVVDRIHTEVLTEKQAWERIQLTFLFIDGVGGTKVHLSVDGKYASGIGAVPPPLQSYRDMEVEYSPAVQDYAKLLVSDLTRPITPAPKTP
jgi:hypothetical protein